MSKWYPLFPTVDIVFGKIYYDCDNKWFGVSSITDKITYVLTYTVHISMRRMTKFNH